jgi:hypothetical protein
MFSYAQLQKIEALVGTPFYICHRNKFERNFDRIYAAFSAHYPKFSLAYSYKTNYIPYFCGIIRDKGGWAEVVSRTEYELALRIGQQSDRIIFNGPVKHPDDIHTALKNNSVINLDSAYELPAVLEYARCNPERPVRGGGRIVGESCHFMDLLAYLAGAKITSVAAHKMGAGVAVQEDKMSISMGFEDGSVGTVNYYANGSKSYPKEQLEVFSDQRVLKLDNFRKTIGYGFCGFSKFKTSRQDKGHNAEFTVFVERLRSGGEPLIPLEELVNVTLASFAAMTSAMEQRTIVLAKKYGELVT